MQGFGEVSWGAAAVVIRLGSGIILLPLIIRHFSTNELALWYLLQSIAGIATLVDFGFGPNISRAASAYWAGATEYLPEGLQVVAPEGKSNVAGLYALIVTARKLYGWVSFLALVISIPAELVILHAPSATKAGVSELVSCLIFSFGISVGLYGRMYNTILYGIGAVTRSQKIGVVSTGAYMTVAAIVISSGGGLLGLSASMLITPLVDQSLSRFALRRAIGSWHGTFWHSGLVRVLWPNSWRIGLMWLGSFLVYNATTLIIGYYCNSEQIAAYGVSNQIINAIAQVCGVVLTVKLPAIIAFRAQGAIPRVRKLFVQRLIFSTGGYIICALLVLLVGPIAISAVSRSAHLLPRYLLGAFLLIRLLEFIHVQHATIVLTENRVPFTWIALGAGATATLASLWLVPRMGIPGVLLAIGVTQLVTNNWYVVYRAWRGLHDDAMRSGKSTVAVAVS